MREHHPNFLRRRWNLVKKRKQDDRWCNLIQSQRHHQDTFFILRLFVCWINRRRRKKSNQKNNNFEDFSVVCFFKPFACPNQNPCMCVQRTYHTRGMFQGLIATRFFLWQSICHCGVVFRYVVGLLQFLLVPYVVPILVWFSWKVKKRWMKDS